MGMMDWLKLAGPFFEKLVDPLRRGADALERIAKSLERLVDREDEE
jgi:hypothetical protein